MKNIFPNALKKLHDNTFTITRFPNLACLTNWVTYFTIISLINFHTRQLREPNDQIEFENSC